jgi:hypothetical protein
LALAFPAAGSVQGRLVLAPGDVNLTFKRYVRDRISLTIEDDHVVAIEGQGLDADHERSRAGMAKDSERQRSRVSTETPTSRETSPTDAVFGGSSLASTLCLKDLPYRANLSSSIAPGLMKKAAGQAVDLWTMRCAHRPACRGQRWRVAHRTGLRPQAPQPPTTIIFKPAIVQNCWIYGSDNYSDAGGNPKANYAVLANANEKIRADCKSSTRQ